MTLWGMRLLEHAGNMKEVQNAYKILVQKPVRKSPLLTSTRTFDGSNKIHHTQSLYYIVHWIYMAQDMMFCLLFTTMSLRISGKAMAVLLTRMSVSMPHGVTLL
jgi:hypothetical protein